ncbi:MAG TPA: RHS repeat domain-containing protein [Pedobacter sp.]|jgi:YD repeat-containing protein
MNDKSSNIGVSPSSASMVKSISTEVNQYTGVPNIGADLTILKARGFSIPISLSYNATGIKVQDVSSTVGLNWTISTNSLITRIVRGLPDEEPGKGYFGSDMGIRINGVMDTATLTAINKNLLDAEPDLFYYSISGSSGKFVFDKDKKPLMLQDNGLRILNSPFKKELGIDGWILADLFGNQFHLGIDATSIESTVTTILGQTPAEHRVQPYTSSWYLKIIITSNNLETINYHYEAGSEIKTVTYNKSLLYGEESTSKFSPGQWPFRKDRVYNSTWFYDKKIWDSNIEDVISSPKYLSSITSSDQSAHFSYDLTSRMDLLNGRVLRNIEIKNNLGDILKSFIFNQSMVKSKDLDRLDEIEVRNELYKNNDLPLQQCCPSMEIYEQTRNKINYLRANADILTVTDYDNYISSNFGSTPTTPRSLYDQYRMKLDNVILRVGNSAPIFLYRFEYNKQNIPPRYSKKMDHWGYINNNAIKEHFTFGHEEEINDDFTINRKYFDSGILQRSKTPNEKASQTGILNKIIYQTGGSKQFSFEQNNYFNNKTSINVLAGGLRIARIVDVAGYNAPPLVTKFEYNDSQGNSTGKLLGLPSKYITSIEHNKQIGMVFQLSPAMFDPVQVTKLTPPTNTIGCLVYPQPFRQQLVNSLSSQVFNAAISSFLSAGSMELDHTISPYYFVNFNSLNTISDLNGNTVGYSQVTIDNNGGGKTVNRFTDEVDYPDLENQFQVDLNFKQVAEIDANASPFTPRTSYDFARGYLQESLVYDKNATLLKKITNEYKFDSKVDSVRGFRCAIGLVVLNVSYTFQRNASTYFNVGYYSHISKKLLLASTKEESFEPGQVTPITRTINYTYHSIYPTLLKAQSTLQSDNTSLITEYKYVVDKDEVSYNNISEANAASFLATKERYALQLSQTVKKDAVIINSSKVGYKSFLVNGKNLYLPETIYEGKSGNLEAQIQLNYDEFGNIIEQTKSGGIKQSTKWGYNHLYPVAQVRNAASNEFFTEDFEVLDNPNILSGNAHSGRKYLNGDYTVNFNAANIRKYNLSYWFYSNGTWHFSGNIPYSGTSALLSLGDAIDDVRVLPEDALMTNYAYNSAFGLLSETDAKSSVTSYSYDDFNRLKAIKDNKGNIVKYFTYNDVSTPVQSTQEKVFARVEILLPPVQSQTPYPENRISVNADTYIRFYSDAACTKPVVIFTNFMVGLKTIKNNAASEEFYTSPFFSSEINLGKKLIYEEYNSDTNTRVPVNYKYSVIGTVTNYTPVGTIPQTFN